MLDDNGTLGVLGCGTVGEAIVRGLLRAGTLPPARLLATTRRAEAEGTGTLGETELPHPQRDGSAGDEEQLASLVAQPGHRLDQRHQASQRQGPAVVGDHLGPQLHHQPPGAPQRRSSERLW